MSLHRVDVAIIGAGPTGLFATYYAGFRGLSVALIDSLPELGGQVSAMYPEKAILDVAGFPSVKGRELIAGLVAQAQTASPTYLLGHTATDLEVRPDGVRLGLSGEVTVEASAVVITAGIGKFSPRPLPVGEEWVGRGVDFFVPDFAPYADRDVAIVGGGDSAFDWAEHLEPIARSVTLIHRREAFRAHARTVEKVRASSVRIITSAQVTAMTGGESLESIEVSTPDGVETLAVHRVVAALGFVADLGAMESWGLTTEKRHVVVDPAMRTNLPRVFAAGDITEYDGKVRLIAVGFGEAATAINNAAVVIDPSAHVFPGHSSEA